MMSAHTKSGFDNHVLRDDIAGKGMGGSFVSLYRPRRLARAHDVEIDAIGRAMF